MTKRKPTALKKLAGNPGGRKLPPEPELPKDMPECPKHLCPEAKREWARVSGELHDAGLLLRVDRSALAGYCTFYARCAQAERHLAKHGLTVMTPNGFEVVSPWVGIANRAWVNMRAFMLEFGMTPSSRSGVSPVKNEPDEFMDYLRRIADRKMAQKTKAPSRNGQEHPGAEGHE
ncbi:MAG: phage terminase small subunit P27 family [Anaerolineales bacterium]|nr:phage terminase small subunit P27 family [Anaerolineales bacterium]